MHSLVAVVVVVRQVDRRHVSPLEIPLAKRRAVILAACRDLPAVGGNARVAILAANRHAIRMLANRLAAKAFRSRVVVVCSREWVAAAVPHVTLVAAMLVARPVATQDAAPVVAIWMPVAKPSTSKSKSPRPNRPPPPKHKLQSEKGSSGPPIIARLINYYDRSRRRLRINAGFVVS